MPGTSIPKTALLAACLALGCAAYLAVFRTEALAGLGPLRNLAATGLALLPYAVAVRLAAQVTQPSRLDLAVLFGGLVLLRLCLPLGAVEGSDDAYRYLWDGLVQSHGINPYAHAPQAEALTPLRDALFHPFVYRPDMRTVYPPLAMLWFRLAYALTPESFVGLKLILLAHEVASTTLALLLLRKQGQGSLRALIYAWSPLAVVQLFAGAHLDGLLVPWLLLSLLLCRRWPLWAGVALALATMVRPLMALCLPALIGRRPLREAALVCAGFALGAALLLLPFISAGRLLVESLKVYARHWHFNGSLFRLAEWALGWRRSRYMTYTFSALGALAAGWLPGRTDEFLTPVRDDAALRDDPRAASADLASRAARYLLALGIYLALAPTVYPWYLLPMVALGGLISRGPLVIALPALVGLSDLVFWHKLDTGRWQVPGVALGLEYGLIAALLALELYRRWFAPPPDATEET
jgi:hypothetical protein